MEEGTKSKKTVFVGGIGDDVDESAIYESFSTFGMYFHCRFAELCTYIQILQVILSKYSCLQLQQIPINKLVGEIQVFLSNCYLRLSRGQTSGVCICDIWILR